MKVWILAVIATLVVSAQTDPIGWQAEEAESKGNIAVAWAMYAQAAALDPGNEKWAGKVLSLRAAALDKAKVAIGSGAEDLPELDPSIVRPITEDELAEVKRMLPPPQLRPNPGTHKFDVRGPARQVIEQTLHLCGIEAIFDSQYDVSQTVQLRLDEASCADAISALGLLSDSFLVAISEKLALVVRDTPEKRREQERFAAITIPLPEPVGVPEAQEAARGVQQLLEIQKFAVDSTRRLVLIRDRVSKVRLAEMLYHQLMTQRPEVVVEVEFLQVTKQRDMTFGVDLQTMTQIVNFGGLLNSTPQLTSMFRGFITFGGGLTLFGIGITDARMFATMTDSQTQLLQRAMVRTQDSRETTLHIGNRFPIITQQFVGEIPEDNERPIYRPPPTIQFEDLGFSMKLTPRIHGATEVTLKIDTEFRVLTGQSNNGIPVIANRQFTGEVRLREGEWAVAAGLTGHSSTRGFTGIIGLSEIPGLGYALRNNTRNRRNDEVLIVLKPQIVNTGAAYAVPRPLWVGTETRSLPPL